MTKDEMRFIRREIINSHLWIITPVRLSDNSELGGRLDNLTLCVRLYERQFYGYELKAYHD
jgi:hypothetical protein